ncbi:protease prtS [Lindgomyces ingoldianus]|uniref:Protease prtS n=1 Tax=Lindgomyces ingoldianus TaxID=673940 RepID=A0ACB6QWH5_9PLEO|nr:protease prtS [Lindgomyces ingoldianus]KAF2470860.1 protease prtS [Lindgomyces ingoldianus]
MSEVCPSGETNQTRAACFFIPPYIHERIVASDLDEKTKLASKKALEVAGNIHDGRYQRAGVVVKVNGARNRWVYDCEQKAELPGKPVRKEGDAAIKDRQVNNCYDALGTTYDFYKSVFNRNSLDNEGLPLKGCVHFKPFEETVGYDNAFWDGTYMVFGDGDGIAFDYFTDSLDVCAHELTHGFVEHSSPLIYYGQSGALNESVADVFACMVEQWYKKQTVEEANWIIGETIFTVAFKGDGLRKLNANKAFMNDENLGTDPQPKNMKNFYKGKGDHGGVHINSGIPNHAFYLAARAVGGYSWEKIGKVWYQTMISGKIPQDCTFETFAESTVEIATKVFPSDTSISAAVKKAWEDVGVLT